MPYKTRWHIIHTFPSLHRWPPTAIARWKTIRRALQMVQGAVLLLGLWAATAPTTTNAQQKPGASPAKKPSNPYGLSPFEWRQVQRVAKANQLTPISFAQAEGKTIEDIHVFTEDPISPEDPFPQFLNAVHITTWPFVVERELLFERGDPCLKARVDESSRNIRGALSLSWVIILPVEGTKPGTVQILVISRDLWSLRTNTNFLFEGTVGDFFTDPLGDALRFFSASLSEDNILGLNKQGALTTLIEQDTFSFGESFTDNRLFGTRMRFSESLRFIFNRDSGSPEGIAGGVSLSRPLFSLRTPWAWSASVAGVDRINRFFQGAEQFQFDNPNTPQVEQLPYQHRNQQLELNSSFSRSYGTAVKTNLSAGYSFRIRDFRYGETEQERQALDPTLVEAFERTFLPRSEQVSSLFFRLSIFVPDFLQLRDFETYALPEDFRFGPSLNASISHADPLIGSDARFDFLSLSGSYRWLFGQRDTDSNPSRNADILSASFDIDTRLEDGEFFDNEFSVGVRNYTPVFAYGRLVSRVAAVYRRNDLSNQISSFGGGAGLRGYPTGVFLARSFLRSNVEWRTLPIEFFTFHFGLIAFYDSALLATEEDLSDQFYVHTTGLGLRWLNPTGNRVVLRFDWGFPIETSGVVFPGQFSFGFQQAF